VIVSEDLAFIADGEAGVRVVDVRDPAKPIEVGRFTSAISTHNKWQCWEICCTLPTSHRVARMILRFQLPR